MSYQKHRHHFIRFGRTCGYCKKLQFYDLRCGSGKILNGRSYTISLYTAR